MSNFAFTPTAIPDVVIIDTIRHGDNRGSFRETWRQDVFDAAGYPYRFVQDNESISHRGVLRGLHFQRKHPQAKLVRAVRGEIFDVAVDLRRGSATYGKWVGTVLSEENGRQLLVPRGFAHGYLVLSETATFAYKCDDIYHPEDEGGILWNDPGIGVVWPDVGEFIINERDRNHPTLAECAFTF